MPGYVLDTSAVLTLLNNEEGTDTVLGLLENARSGNAQVYLPFMTLMELKYQGLRKFGPGEIQRVLSMVRAWPVEIEDSTEAWRHEAATVKATTSVSVTGAWICGLARLLDAELVHKDPAYDAVPDLKALRLPYKHKTN